MNAALGALEGSIASARIPNMTAGDASIQESLGVGGDNFNRRLRRRDDANKNAATCTLNSARLIDDNLAL
jgi:hypothetical protein